MTEDKELELKRIWEKMARTLPPEEVVFGPPGKKWLRNEDFKTFSNLRPYLGINEKDVLLDLGCGPLARSEVQFGLSRNSIVGVDISGTTLMKANETIKKFGLKKKVEFSFSSSSKWKKRRASVLGYYLSFSSASVLRGFFFQFSSLSKK